VLLNCDLNVRPNWPWKKPRYILGIHSSVCVDVIWKTSDRLICCGFVVAGYICFIGIVDWGVTWGDGCG
jgi:hypothetical protein